MARRKRRKKSKKYYIRRIILFIIIVSFFLFAEEIKNTFSLTKEDADKLEKEETKEVITMHDKLKIYFLDVGQADAILIDSGNEYMVIDGGNNADGPLLVKYFKELGIKNIKYVIGTHAHEDHIGGLDDIITNFNVETIYIPDVITTTKTFEDLLDSISKKNMTFKVPKIDSTFTLGESNIQVIYTGTNKDDLNSTSIILKLTYGNNSFLFTGDTTTQIEKQLLDKDIEIDVLKVAHHGSKYSSEAHFLKNANPKYAIISCGKDNSYYFPHTITLKKLERMNTKIYRTDESGTIIATSDGNSISFETIKTNTNGG
jgi:competence protein ComEC